jgi:uncharacterized membrane protein YphA (DoxX/SURF4 family)
VRRLYPDFPLALPGIGLLLLRVALAALLVIEGATRTRIAFAASAPELGALSHGLALIVLAVPVALGFLTPIVHLTVAIVETIALASGELMFSSGWWQATWQATLLQIVIALAIAMIGPGAYSIDGRLFGRREIVIRPRLDDARSPIPSPPRK